MNSFLFLVRNRNFAHYIRGIIRMLENGYKNDVTIVATPTVTIHYFMKRFPVPQSTN